VRVSDDQNGGEWYQDGCYVRNHRRQVALAHCQDEQIAERIVAAVNDRDAALARVAVLEAALDNLVKGKCLPGCSTYTGAPCDCWTDKVKEALSQPGAGGEGGQQDTPGQ
jgi:D-serine deaminase-like pyridoxal phosphate-dependent protein